ncbi:hypothetical protein OG592_27215 [Streptomyces avidinii]|uniref:hypothetical protein n=1 Tax=Streptomyces avidinii TaxID=1895 RepID=UPI00386FD163|nr:hypothetical protein OG592_27215 [Streptomyces avidinii]
MTDQPEDLRAELETGFTHQAWAVGRALCPAREECPAGLVGVFPPLKTGRLPMHRGFLGDPCPGAYQMPVTPLLRLRPTA